MARPGVREIAIAARDAGRILIAGSAAEPRGVLGAVAAEPDLWQGRVLTGAFIPGVNDRDLSAMGHGTAVETIFVTAGLRTDQAAGAVRHLPMHYTAFWDRLARPGVVDLVLMTVPPPRADGTVGHGICADFAPAAIGAGARLIGVVNEAMPDPPGAPRLPVDRFETLGEDDEPLPELAAGDPDPASCAIAARVARLIPRGGTLQIGLGRLQAAILHAIEEAGRDDLRFHGGMVSDGILGAMEAGCFPGGVAAGVALGGRAFYDRLGGMPDIEYLPVSETHSQQRLGAIAGLTSVNSAVEVDLTGQANAEYVGGRQASGQGGMVDFIRGARAARGGLAILTLPSTTRDGAVSRIVPALPPRAPVSVARADVDLVVTEHGVADLREADLDLRAERLIAVADPAFRDMLAGARAAP